MSDSQEIKSLREALLKIPRAERKKITTHLILQGYKSLNRNYDTANLALSFSAIGVAPNSSLGSKPGVGLGEEKSRTMRTAQKSDYIKESKILLRQSYPNTLFSYPFVDVYGTVRDALQYCSKEPDYIDMVPKIRKRAASQIYFDMCIGTSKMRIADVPQALQILNLKYPSTLADSIDIFVRRSLTPPSSSVIYDDSANLTLDLAQWLKIASRCCEYTMLQRESKGIFGTRPSRYRDNDYIFSDIDSNHSRLSENTSPNITSSANRHSTHRQSQNNNMYDNPSGYNKHRVTTTTPVPGSVSNSHHRTVSYTHHQPHYYESEFEVSDGDFNAASDINTKKHLATKQRGEESLHRHHRQNASILQNSFKRIGQQKLPVLLEPAFTVSSTRGKSLHETHCASDCPDMHPDTTSPSLSGRNFNTQRSTVVDNTGNTPGEPKKPTEPPGFNADEPSKSGNSKVGLNISRVQGELLQSQLLRDRKRASSVGRYPVNVTSNTSSGAGIRRNSALAQYAPSGNASFSWNFTVPSREVPNISTRTQSHKFTAASRQHNNSSRSHSELNQRRPLQSDVGPCNVNRKIYATTTNAALNRDEEKENFATHILPPRQRLTPTSVVDLIRRDKLNFLHAQKMQLPSCSHIAAEADSALQSQSVPSQSHSSPLMIPVAMRTATGPHSGPVPSTEIKLAPTNTNANWQKDVTGRAWSAQFYMNKKAPNVQDTVSSTAASDQDPFANDSTYATLKTSNTAARSEPNGDHTFTDSEGRKIVRRSKQLEDVHRTLDQSPINFSEMIHNKMQKRAVPDEFDYEQAFVSASSNWKDSLTFASQHSQRSGSCTGAGISSFNRNEVSNAHFKCTEADFDDVLGDTNTDFVDNIDDTSQGKYRLLSDNGRQDEDEGFQDCKEGSSKSFSGNYGFNQATTTSQSMRTLASNNELILPENNYTEEVRKFNPLKRFVTFAQFETNAIPNSTSPLLASPVTHLSTASTAPFGETVMDTTLINYPFETTPSRTDLPDGLETQVHRDPGHLINEISTWDFKETYGPPEHFQPRENQQVKPHENPRNIANVGTRKTEEGLVGYEKTANLSRLSDTFSDGDGLSERELEEINELLLQTNLDIRRSLG